MMDVDESWNGEDEPGLWVDWDDDGLRSSATAGAEEIPDDLFDLWDPELDRDQTMSSVVSNASQDPVLSRDPELVPLDDFSGAVYSAGGVGSRQKEKTVGNNISKGVVGSLPQLDQVGSYCSFCFCCCWAE